MLNDLTECGQVHTLGSRFTIEMVKAGIGQPAALRQGSRTWLTKSSQGETGLSCWWWPP